MALYRNGYFYHTPKDAFEHISPGTLQHFGGNILSLLRQILFSGSSYLRKSSSECFQEESRQNLTKTTYFDVGGVFMIYYSAETNAAFIVALATGVLWSLFRNRRYRITGLSSIGVMLSLVLSVVGAIGAPLLLGFLGSSVLEKPMIWYSSPWLALLLYFPMSMAGILLALFIASFVSTSNEAEFTSLFFLISTVISFTLVLAGFYFQVGAIFFGIMYSTCFCIAAGSKNPESRYFMFSGPLFLISDICFQFLETIVPIAGRAGLKPVDMIVSGFCGLIGVFLLLPLLPLCRFKFTRKQLILISFTLMLFSVGVFGVLSMRESVYSPASPKRVLVEHVNTMDSEESYFLFIPSDNIPFTTETMPSEAFPQLSAYTRKFHSKLPTIPCLNPEEGKRWEMKANRASVSIEPSVQVEKEESWAIHVSAPHAFNIEITISSASYIQSCDIAQEIESFSDSDEFKIRLFDGDGTNNFAFHVAVSGKVKVDMFINYLEEDTSAPINQLIDSLPNSFVPVGCITFHKTFLLY